ncbi:hypothetical protein KDA_43110 [Dictyobacter alpinus]|uniref:Copper-containing nitrite reductase n=1 Tax=Dictyobacter alpinus TaxID=2014873 RepID=A0A402BC27_9CHLR|nr:multicopper oxidase family protein [Dictyobacter alpinus]GCE28827.1 hypothetical protein KDA_43110 [Dictyobacter alpinus]
MNDIKQAKVTGTEKDLLSTSTGKKRSRKRYVRRVLLGLLCILVAGGALFGWGMWSSRYPDRINMGTACDMGSMPGMDMSSTQDTMCQGNTHTSGTPIAALQAPQTAAHVDTFTLIAQSKKLTLGSGNTTDAWTFNGTSPGPTLHARQGDLLIVHLVNHLSVCVSIHWHGIAVPNIADGVAGVTQDAVKPGQTYTYRFVVNDPGTYWYHSHQESFDQTNRGLFGMLVVAPKTPAVHDDVDMPLALHSWNGAFTLNGNAGTLQIAARPGQWVRLRLVDTNSSYQLTLAGTPFMVAALDGHDINQPAFLTTTTLAVDGGQRYDLRFQMPAQGSVALFAAHDGEQQYPKQPALLVGTGAQAAPTISKTVFDFAHYGQPLPEKITPQSHFDITYTISLGTTIGFSNGRPGPVFTLNGKAFPDTPNLLVKPGQLVRLRFENGANNGIHPMHLHGHTFTLLTKNGHALTGSPIHLDTISLHPGESYEVAFYADNPGLWMIHCHNLFHANHGMDMMLVYPNISTPYSIGNASGNFPD